MNNVNVIDKAGEWFMNTALFPFVDAETGNRFEPGVPVKVKPNDWIKSQEMLVACPDPFGDEELPKVIEATGNTLVPVDAKTGEAVPAAAPGATAQNAKKK